MFNKILFFGRKNDVNSTKILAFLKKKSKIVKVVWSTSPNEKLKLKSLFKHNYDYIFCFRSFFILKKNLINKAKYAAINFHPGPPEYRGTGCINYAMYEKQKYYGVTCHVMDDKVDYGKIIKVKRFKLLNKTHNILFKEAIKIINLLSQNSLNIKKLIYRSRNEKWSRKIKKRKDLDNFYNIGTNIPKVKLIKKIRSTYTDKFRPYVMLHKFKFVLLDPNVQTAAKNKNKMYFNLPSDLIKKYE